MNNIDTLNQNCRGCHPYSEVEELTVSGKDRELLDFTVSLLSGEMENFLRHSLEEEKLLNRCICYWQQQRIIPLAARIVAREPGFPTDWKQWAGQALRANAILALQHLDRIRGLVKQLEDEAGIQAMPLKGVVLSMLLYDDPSFRQCGDIDLLVPRDRFDEAVQVLLRHRYQRWLPDDFTTDGRMKPFYHRFRHEVALSDTMGGASVELHHRMCNLRGLLPEDFEEVRAGAAAVNAGDVMLYTPGANHILAFLAVHAMFSRWSAMKWLYDLPMVIERFGADVVDVAYRQAEDSGFTPLLDAALFLGARLTGREAPLCRGSESRRAVLVDGVWTRLGDGLYAVENRRDALQLAAFRMRLLEGFLPRVRLIERNLSALLRQS